MKEVRVRNLEDHVVQALRGRARRNGHSLEGELRALLTEEALRPKRELMDSLQQLREDILAESGEFPESAPMFRQMRETL